MPIKKGYFTQAGAVNGSHKGGVSYSKSPPEGLRQ